MNIHNPDNSQGMAAFSRPRAPVLATAAKVRRTPRVRRWGHAATTGAYAREAGMSVGNYLRTGRGLPERPAGRPSIEELERERDRAWEMLKSLGEDPAAYFPPDDSWMDEYR